MNTTPFSRSRVFRIELEDPVVSGTWAPIAYATSDGITFEQNRSRPKVAG